MNYENNIYKTLYYKLFGSCEDILSQLREFALHSTDDPETICGAVSTSLIETLNECEEMFLESDCVS